MPKKEPKTSLARLIFGFRQKNSREKTLKTQGNKLKTQYFGFFKNISKASYLTSRRLGYQILNVERKKKLKTEKLKKKLKTQEKTQNSSQKLKNSAFLRPLHAEKMAKKPACFTRIMVYKRPWKTSSFPMKIRQS